MNWNGIIVIAFRNRQEYAFKSKGLWKNKYLIEDINGEVQLELFPDFSWRKMNYNYNISIAKEPGDTLLIFLSLYAANYFISTMAGAAGGA